LFWNSQSDTEKAHIIAAFRFELTKVQTQAIRSRMVAGLRNVADELAQGVADGLGMPLPEPLPRALDRVPRAEVSSSKALSLFARPGEDGIMTRRIAILVADGIDGETARNLHAMLAEQGAVPRFVGVKLGQAASASGEPIEAEISLEAGPSVLYDALVLPDGQAGVDALMKSGHAIEFLKDQYRHCKPILVLGAASALLDKAGIPAALPSGAEDPGLLRFGVDDADAAFEAFVTAITKHRHYERETDPPLV
jgi:catalase